MSGGKFVQWVKGFYPLERLGGTCALWGTSLHLLHEFLDFHGGGGGLLGEALCLSFGVFPGQPLGWGVGDLPQQQGLEVL